MTNQTKESETSDARGSVRGYTSISPATDEVICSGTDGRGDLELSIMGNVAEEINDDMLLEELKVELFPFSWLILVLPFYFYI